MPTRRQVVFGLSTFFVTGGVLGSAASGVTSSSESVAFAVVYERPIALTAVNDPPIHVRTNEDGYVTEITPGDGRGVNRRAITRFEDVVRVTNVGSVDVTGISFAFEATSDTLSADVLADIEDALAATAGDETLASAGDPGADLLAASGRESVEDGVLAPGESVPFGVQVDLVPDSGRGTLSDLPDGDYDVALRVVVERGDVSG